MREIDGKKAKYPVYYKKGGRCLRRGGDTTVREIRVPATHQDFPCCMEDLVFADKEALDREVMKMNRCSQDDYEAYIGAFTAAARAISEKFNDYRQTIYDHKL